MSFKDELDELADKFRVDDPVDLENETEIRELPARLAKLHDLLAEGVAAVSIADRDYRRWRAEMTEGILEADPKLSEYKVTSKINAELQFRTFQTILAERQQKVDVLRGYIEATRARIQIYVSLIA